MLEKKELNEEELEQVNGGKIIEASGDLSDYSDYIIPITVGTKGQNYLFKSKSDSSRYQGWIYGTLSNIYIGFAQSVYTYDIKVIAFQGKYGDNAAGWLKVSDWDTIEFNETQVQMYSC